MSKFFDIAKELSRRDGARKLEDAIPYVDDMPTLHPDELRWVERMVGRTLTNDEAQMELRAASIDAAVRYWADGRVN
jgi:hypothetical protein